MYSHVLVWPRGMLKSHARMCACVDITHWPLLPEARRRRRRKQLRRLLKACKKHKSYEREREREGTRVPRSEIGCWREVVFAGEASGFFAGGGNLTHAASVAHWPYSSTETHESEAVLLSSEISQEIKRLSVTSFCFFFWGGGHFFFFYQCCLFLLLFF